MFQVLLELQSIPDITFYLAQNTNFSRNRIRQKPPAV
jgi:hypothetical protein